MSEPDEPSRPRRRSVRRAASTSASAGAAPPPRGAGVGVGRRQLSALAAGAGVALCRLQYYLDRTNTYQADLEAQQPLEQLIVSSIDATFRTDIKCYLLALQRDIRRLEGLLRAMEAANRGLSRTAESASALSESEGQWSTAGFSTSSGESDEAHETNSTVSQRRQRRRECQTASASQLTTLRTVGNATESGGEREDSSSDGGVRDSLTTRQSGSTGRPVEDGLVASGCGASANAVGGTGADDGCLACPHCGGSEGQVCPLGGTGVVSQDAHPYGGVDTEYGGEVPPSNSIGTATEFRTEVVNSDSKREQPTRTWEDDGEAQPSSCSSVAKVEAQATGAVCDREMRGSASASGKSSNGTNSTNPSSRLTVKSAKSSARRVDGNFVWKGNQNKSKTTHGSEARPPSPHPLAPGVLAAATASPFAAREVLRGLSQQHGLLRRLLTAHSQRLLRRTCAAALQLGAGQRLSLEQLSLQQPLSRLQLRRAVAAARAEQLQTAAVLAELQLRARCFCEAARRLRACRPRRPQRPPRRRRCTAAPAAAVPPPPPQQPEGAFNLEGLLALCLCWTDTTSD